MAVNKRWLVLAPLLIATLVAAVYPVKPSTGATAPLMPPKARPVATATSLTTHAAAPSTAATVAITAPADRLPALATDPFDAVDWDATPPPPPPPPPPPRVVEAPAPPPEPQEPEMPYRFLGRMEQDGSTVVYLARGQDSVVAHVGDTLDGDYKVVAIDAHKLTIEYLPMHKRHDIALDTP